MSAWKEKLSQLPAADAAAIIAVGEEAVVSVTGDDAARLLQGQLTADMLKLAPGQSVGAALCNPQGRIVALMRVYRIEGGFLLRTAADNQARLTETLSKYAVFFKVEIELQPNVGLLLALTEEIPDQGVLAQRARPDATTELLVTLQGFEQAAASFDLAVSDSAWRQSQIHCGEPSIYANQSGKLLPHALSLDLSGMISFDKGCYTGQEIVARTHYRGKSKRRLAAIATDPVAVAVGDTLVSADGAAVAEILMVAAGPDQSELLLSAVDPLETGTPLFGDGQQLGWQRISLPWEDT